MSDASGGTLRDRQKEAVRRELRDAALDLFRRQGFAATSVDEIARRAGVSRSTFFRYFGSKETILASQTDETTGIFLRCLRERPAGEGRMKALENALVELTETNRTDERREELLALQQIVEGDAALRAAREATGAQWRHDVARVLAERDGRGEPDLEDNLAAAILSEITDHIGAQWSSETFDAPVAPLIRRYFETVRRVAAG